MLTLLLVCSFSPRVHSIPRGPRLFLRFFVGSENPSVLGRTRIFRFSEKLKKARIIAVKQGGTG